MRLRPFYLHPLIFAIFPVVNLYSINIYELLPASMVVPLAVYVTVAILLVVGGSLWYDYPEKGALMASAIFLISTLMGNGFLFLDKYTAGTYLLDGIRGQPLRNPKHHRRFPRAADRQVPHTDYRARKPPTAHQPTLIEGRSQAHPRPVEQAQRPQ